MSELFYLKAFQIAITYNVDRIDEFDSKYRFSSVTIYCPDLTDEMVSRILYIAADPCKVIHEIHFDNNTTSFARFIRLLNEWPSESLRNVSTIGLNLKYFYKADLETRKAATFAIIHFLSHFEHPLQLDLHESTFASGELSRIISADGAIPTKKVSMLNLGPLNETSTEEVDFILKSTSNTLEILTIAQPEEQDSFENSLFKNLTEFGNLTELRLSGKFSGTLKELSDNQSLHWLPVLESLRLDVFERISADQLSAILKFPRLKELFISPVQLLTQLEFPQSSLESLNIKFEDGTSAESIISLLESPHNLKHLKVSYPAGQTEMSKFINVFLAASWAQKIESLSLQTKFEDEAFQTLCSYFVSNTSISNLSLLGISFSTESVGWLSEMIKKNSSIERLRIQSPFWTTDSIIQITNSLSVNQCLLSMVFLYGQSRIHRPERRRITKNYCYCLDKNHRIAQLSSPFIVVDEPVLVENETLQQKLNRNLDEFIKEMRMLCLRGMMNLLGYTIPNDLMRIILEMSGFSQSL
jgi:hypothetical protein